jgi:mono/diheme cytochrome c family protein
MFLQAMQLHEITTTVDNSWLRPLTHSLLLRATLLVSFALATASCDSASSKSEYALTATENHGRLIYQANCAICHNPYKKEPLQGPPMVGVFRKKELPSGIPVTDAHVRDTILLGRRNMPTFKGLLSDQQIDDLLAYLHTL